MTEAGAPGSLSDEKVIMYFTKKSEVEKKSKASSYEGFLPPNVQFLSHSILLLYSTARVPMCNPTLHLESCS